MYCFNYTNIVRVAHLSSVDKASVTGVYKGCDAETQRLVGRKCREIGYHLKNCQHSIRSSEELRRKLQEIEEIKRLTKRKINFL